MILSRKFLGPEDHVLLIDDFLANGCALLGLIDIVKKSGATLEGAGIVIEKGFQHGGQEIRDMGIRLESLAIVDSMTDDSLTSEINYKRMGKPSFFVSMNSLFFLI
mgnify:CR=1 FL=1